MTTLEEKVNDIVINVSEEFNSLSIDERRRIGKYMSYQQILTIWQMLHKDESITTKAWREKQRNWLGNCVRSFENRTQEGK